MNINRKLSAKLIRSGLFQDSSFIKVFDASSFSIFIKGSKFSERILKSSNFRDLNTVYSNISKMDFALVVILLENEILLCNDPFGAYPLYLMLDKDNEAIVDNLNFLNREVLTNYDDFAIADYYLFHHVVGQNTLHQNVKRIPGHSVIRIDKNGNIEVKKNPAVYGTSDVIKISDALALSNQLSLGKSNHKTFLTLTGGYDSRLLLSLLLSEKADFETLTWGIKGNLQTEVAKELSEKFNLIHHEIELGNDFTARIPQYIRQIFEKTPDSPFILDMPQFIYYSDLIAEKYGSADLVTGFMGSELLRGPSYSSEVLLTKFVADLYRTKSYEQLKKLILDKLINSKLFKNEFVYDSINSLAERYVLYSSVGYENLNSECQVDYLLKEKYGKIYSQIIRLHNSSINLINPYLNIDFINNQIQRNYTEKELFTNSKLKNFKSYQYYAKLINEIFPPLLNTKVDKGGYYIKDLLSFRGISSVLLEKYIFMRKNKLVNKYSPVLNYSFWLKDYVKEAYNSVDTSQISIINFSAVRSSINSKFEALSRIEQNSIIILGGILMFDNFLRNDFCSSVNVPQFK